MGEQKPLKTGPSDRHVENKISANQQKTLDTVKLGLVPQKMDKNTLSHDAARNEKIKELAQTVKWWEPIILREATAKDIPFLQAMTWEAILASPILLASYGVEAVQHMEEQYWRKWEEHPDPAFVALDTTGQKLGAITLKPNGADLPVSGWRIGIAVQAQARSRGIGQRLIEQAITFVREQGASYVNLFVDPTNTKAIALYQRMGFVERGKISLHAPELGTGSHEGDERGQLIEMRITF